ncbi:MAG TPA: hypothetical protein VIF83_09175 [Gemmatimonadaceae bacterium]|jgi:hypothetical protein
MDTATISRDTAARPDEPPRTPHDPAMPVRSADLEPYIGLGYLSKLFKLMAGVLLLLLVAEVVTGLVAQGTAAIVTLLGEASRLIVLAGLLWGSGDLALLLIDIGHDVRATRILLGRQALHEEHSHTKREPAAFVDRAPR